MPEYRYAFRGSLHAAEEFSYGFSVTGSGTLPDAAAAGEAAHDAFLGVTDIENIWHTGVVWSTLVTSELGAIGAPVVDSQVDTITGAGGSTDPSCPSQCAICVSVLTGFSGPRNRGRFFLPTPSSFALQGNGRITDAFRAILASGLTAMVSSLDGDGFSIQLVSASQNAYVAATALRVGNVVDTMRSRRNQLAEVYTTVSA